MRDIPGFTTQYGIASLILKEIPYSADAYVRIQCAEDAEKLLQECISFCHAAGAERIYATGHQYLEEYPFHNSVLSMHCPRGLIADTDAILTPMQEETLEQWRTLYNTGMKGIDNASYMTLADARKLLAANEGYFIYRDSCLVGIGAASCDTICAVISLQRGAGADVVSALCRGMTGDRVTLEVASTNIRALKLYQRMGFRSDGEISRWYKII